LPRSEVIIDNKVFNFNGTLRFSGGATGPHSRTTVVSKLLGPGPEVITGKNAYRSIPAVWTGTQNWLNAAVGPLAYPAIAELDAAPGPEIVVTDTMATTLRVLASNGTQLASIAIPNPAATHCGGPPMIGDAHPGFPGPEIGVATCTRYTLFRYNAGTLSVIWTKPTNDPSGQTTSTLFNTPTGARIYYTDADNLWVFNGVNGAVLQSVANTSNTSMEGPVIAAFDTGQGQGRVVLGANDYHLGGGHQRGLRIFNESSIGPAVSYWNQHTYHYTNVTNSHGLIPLVEQPNWLNRNTYRVQQWP
jgi:hypothetical protein